MRVLSNSIRTQLILVVIVSLLILAITLQGIHFYQQQAIFINSEYRVGLTLIRSVNNTINSVRSFINTLRDIAELNERLHELVQLNTNIDFIAIADSSGQVIFHSNDRYENTQIVEFTKLLDMNTTFAKIPGFGEVLLTAAAFDSAGLTDTPQYWIIVASATEPIQQLLLDEVWSSIFVALLFTLIVGFGLIVFLQSYFVYPLEQLTKVANEIEHGNLDKQVPIKRSNELGQLARSFNQMTHELANSINQLEQRVKERTRELEIARDQAERANKIKSSFLANMSHELRTPLNAILNFSQFLSSGMLGAVNNEQIDLLENITSSGKHLLNLINDVLDVSKIEAGSLRLFVEPGVDVSNEIKAVARTGLALLKDKPVKLGMEIAPDVPFILADKRRIRQILINLVSNACKFTETGEIVIQLASQGDQIHISVRDTGPGIAPGDAEIIFETFRQATAGLQQGTGTGLGLAISRRLAEAHGGSMWVESELGQGSNFHVLLPVYSSALDTLRKETTS